MANKLQIDTSFNKDIQEAALKAAVMFRTFGFTWGDEHIPTFNEIEQHIVHQVDELLENDYEFTSSGRITTRIVQEDEDHEYVEVSFDLATIYDDREV